MRFTRYGSGLRPQLVQFLMEPSVIYIAILSVTERQIRIMHVLLEDHLERIESHALDMPDKLRDPIGRNRIRCRLSLAHQMVKGRSNLRVQLLCRPPSVTNLS